MRGSVTVIPAGTAYPATQADYDAAAQTQEARFVTLDATGW
jgi:hypothetical protein